MSHWIATRLIRFHGWLLGFAVVAMGLSLPMSRRLDLTWQVEGMFADDDPLVTAYRRLQSRFGGNDICLAVYRDPQIWDASGAGLERLKQVRQRLVDVEGVYAAVSLAELHELLKVLKGPLGFLSQSDGPPPLLDPDDELAQALAEVFEGYTHRRSSNYVAIACMLQSTEAELAISGPNGAVPSRVGPSKHETTLAELKSILADLPEPASGGLLTGEPVLVAEGFRMVQRDGIRLGVIASILVSVVLLASFRSIRWTIIPLAVVHWALLATKAALVWLDFDLTMISSTLTANITVIGVATSTHFLLRYQDLRRRGESRQQAMTSAYAVLLAPIFWACVTDAVGFSALMIAGVGPVRDFGLMMALGAMMVFVAILLVVPGLALLGNFDPDPRTPKQDLLVRLWLRKVLDRCLAQRRWGLLTLGVLFVVAVWGCMRLEVETDFTKSFHSESAVVQGYRVIEDELGGAGVWDVMLPVPKVLSPGYFTQVAELETRLRELQVVAAEERVSLTKVLSLTDAVSAADSNALARAIPTAAKVQAMRVAMPEFTSALFSNEPDATGFRWLRVMLRSKEQTDASTKAKLVGEVERTLQAFTQQPSWKKVFDESPPSAEIAGYHVMLGKLVASVLEDQWRCFLLASLGIFLAMSLATRSPWFALMALLPNALPILAVLGFMGWFGMRANMGAAMIAAVSLGLSVDSSIHYLMHYQRRRREGARPLKALRSAQENVGFAVLLATIALVSGFVCLCASEFVPTVVFGVLASLTMLGGLIGNLMLLPMLILPRNG